MVRKFDKYGLNRQFKNKPCSRRDPFPRDHLPFVDDMSNKKTLDEAIKAVKKNDFKKRSRAEIEKAHKAIRDRTKKLRKGARNVGRAMKKGVSKAVHSKLEQYALEAAGFGLQALAAAAVLMTDGAAAPLAEAMVDEGIELQALAAAEMAGEGAAVAAGEGEAVTEETSLLGRRTVRRRTTRSGREY